MNPSDTHSRRQPPLDPPYPLMPPRLHEDVPGVVVHLCELSGFGELALELESDLGDLERVADRDGCASRQTSDDETLCRGHHLGRRGGGANLRIPNLLSRGLTDIWRALC